ncbi:MAG: BrnA antitoxin family protein, partial [SAR324 cluster bacterium]|nr:BrnA antitoxin family protein [SAR324 cluster bacterium]
AGPEKHQVNIQLDQDVIEWFKGQGKEYQTKINSVLRAYMQDHN